jgi:hypothetical protein
MQFRRVPGRDSAQVVTPFVQVGTYPTRNFALHVSLDPLLLRDRTGRPWRYGRPSASPQRSDHLFFSIEREGRRMVSEDPHDWRRGFPAGCPHSHIVTAVIDRRRVVKRCSGFPAYSRLRIASSPMRGAAPFACQRASYLRTVIVTAAVYRRLDSELRKSEDLLTPPLNVPAPGRRQWVYSALRLRTHLCF